LEEIKDNLKKDGIDWRDTVLPASPDNDIEDEAIEMMDKEHFERQLRK